MYAVLRFSSVVGVLATTQCAVQGNKSLVATPSGADRICSLRLQYLALVYVIQL